MFKKFITWFLFVCILFVCLIVVFNFRYFALQFRMSFFNDVPKITLPQTAQDGPKLENANKLWIPSLGITAPIVYITEANEKTYQAALASGAVHFPQTAEPGEFGNVYIFGHSSDYAWSQGAYKTVFALLTKIQPSAEILVSNKQGEVFTYVVKTAKVIGSNDIQYLSQQGYTKKLLTLQTSYPIGTALKRYLVIAEIKTSDK